MDSMKDQKWDLAYDYNNEAWTDQSWQDTQDDGIWLCEKHLRQYVDIPRGTEEITLLWSASPHGDCWQYRVVDDDHLDLKRPDDSRYETLFVSDTLIETIPSKGYLSILF